MNLKRVAAVALILVGILAVILGFCAYGADTGYTEIDKEYGGDAYTGIQNAAAQTARNLVNLTEAIAFAGGSILLIGGLALIGAGIATLPEEEYGPVTYAPQSQETPPPAPRPHDGRSHESAVATWTCTCGRTNPDYQQTCSCGVTKQQTRQAPKLTEKQGEA